MGMGRLLLIAMLVACAQASSQSSDAPSDTPKPVDASLDGNGCSVQPCSILPQCGCGGVTACDIDTSDNTGTACRSVLTPGTETAACDSLEGCDKGYVCLGGSSYASCKKYCSSNADCGSPRGQCVITISNGGTPLAGIPQACSSNCEPTSTNPAECPSTYKCGLFTASNNTKIADCSPAGTRTQGQDCTSGTTGNDTLCAKGHLCTTINGGTSYQCRRICQKAASNCGALACISFTTPHTISGVEYGVCN